MSVLTSVNRCRAAKVLFVAAAMALIVLAGCMQSAYVPWRPGDNEALVNRLAGETFNVIRFKTAGGSDDQVLWGYLLYPDNVLIRLMNPEQELGRMTLKEVLADYRKATYASVVARGSMVQEFIVDGRVACYSVNDIRLAVDLWRDPGATEPGRLVLILSYTDTRTKADEGSIVTH